MTDIYPAKDGKDEIEEINEMLTLETAERVIQGILTETERMLVSIDAVNHHPESGIVSITLSGKQKIEKGICGEGVMAHPVFHLSLDLEKKSFLTEIKENNRTEGLNLTIHLSEGKFMELSNAITVRENLQGALGKTME